jgi:hypothetical protein
VERLTALLEQDMGGSIAAIDTRCKKVQRDLFTTYVYNTHGGADGCQTVLTNLYDGDFNATDAAKVNKQTKLPS